MRGKVTMLEKIEVTKQFISVIILYLLNRISKSFKTYAGKDRNIEIKLDRKV